MNSTKTFKRNNPARPESPASRWIGRLLILIVIAYVGFLILAPIFALLFGAFEDGLGGILRVAHAARCPCGILVDNQNQPGGRDYSHDLWYPGRLDCRSRSLSRAQPDQRADRYALRHLSGCGWLYAALAVWPQRSIRPTARSARYEGRLRSPWHDPGDSLCHPALHDYASWCLYSKISACSRNRQLPPWAPSGWQTFWRVTLPALRWGFVYGITLTFARALGEFGAILVIGGGIQGRTETATLFIYRALDERMYTGAYSAALVLGVISLFLVSGSEILHRREKR